LDELPPPALPAPRTLTNSVGHQEAS
jgi:hypothetical protein